MQLCSLIFGELRSTPSGLMGVTFKCEEVCGLGFLCETTGVTQEGKHRLDLQYDTATAGSSLSSLPGKSKAATTFWERYLKFWWRSLW